jgi:RNA polymerase sigma-70 factor (ECF subfamily)
MSLHPPQTLQHLVEDHQAFDEVVERFYRVAFHRVHNHHDAEDIVQQSLLNALQAEDTFEGQCLLTTWLGQIVCHQAGDLLRRRQRFPHMALEQNAVSQLATNFEATINAKIDGGRILAALPKLLTPAEAQVVHYYYALGWTCKEIAKRLGKTPLLIRQLLYRALSKLRNYFARDLCHEAETQKTGRNPGRLFRCTRHWESRRSATIA